MQPKSACKSRRAPSQQPRSVVKPSGTLPAARSCSPSWASAFLTGNHGTLSPTSACLSLRTFRTPSLHHGSERPSCPQTDQSPRRRPNRARPAAASAARYSASALRLAVYCVSASWHGTRLLGDKRLSAGAGLPHGGREDGAVVGCGALLAIALLPAAERIVRANLLHILTARSCVLLDALARAKMISPRSWKSMRYRLGSSLERPYILLKVSSVSCGYWLANKAIHCCLPPWFQRFRTRC